MQFFDYNFLAVANALIQIAQFQSADDPTDPLISRGSDAAIYVGLILLAFAFVPVIKGLHTKVEHALVVAFVFSVALLVILWYL